jgi:hypothetical protein
MIPSTNRPAKSHYSESEAAAALGVSVDALRTVIRRHILKTDEEMANVPQASFQPSDLLILRMILNGLQPPTEPAPASDTVHATA